MTLRAVRQRRSATQASLKLGLRTPAESIRHGVHLSSVEHAGTPAAER